jgi:superfamily I DNA/RNA helicase
MFRPGRPAVVLFQHNLEVVEFIKDIVSTEGADNELIGLLNETLADLPDLMKDRNLWRETRKAWDEVNKALSRLNVPVRFLGKRVGSLADADGQGLLYVMTCHSAKGLDFETVFVPDCEGFEKVDPLVKNLFYVALTRARRNLFLLGSAKAQIHAKLKDCDFVRTVNVDVEELKREEEDDDLF